MLNFVVNLDCNIANVQCVHFLISICTLQWYPGHIAKTEKELKGQLKLMDVVIEVRDARIPLATTHPKVIVVADSQHLRLEPVALDSAKC
jgi:hypothetical protein